MLNIKTYATVIAYSNFRENDRMLTLLSPSMGKISVLARGCRKQKSSLLSASELLSTGEFILYSKSNRYYLVSANIENLYYNIRLDAYKYYAACFMLELCIIIAQENEDSRRIYLILNKTLDLLDKHDKHKELAIINRFIFSVLKYAGFKPRIVHCLRCEDKISKDNNEKLGFDYIEGGVICNSCVDEQTQLIDKSVYLELFKLAKFIKYDYDSTDGNVNKRVFSLLAKYIESQLQVKLKTSKFILI